VRHDAQLPVYEIADGDPVRPGAVYIAPANAQTTVAADRRFHLDEGHCRGDPLMLSVGEVYGARCLALVLSGHLRDGAAGLRRIKQSGGRGFVQSPASADADGMPLAAMATGCYDFVLPPEQLLAALVAFVSVPGAAELLGVRGHPNAVGV
jgi:two-component system chemotaxis response regulator CheB